MLLLSFLIFMSNGSIINVFYHIFICEVSVQNCKVYIGVIYRSPNQSTAEFEDFLSNFEDILNTTASSSSLFTIILGDFNARSSSWWKNDKTTVEGARLETLTSLQGFHQLI